MEPTNHDRAQRAAAALRHFQSLTGTDNEDSLCDLLCDLMHFADFNFDAFDLHGFDFDAELARTRDHYQEEKAETRPRLLQAAKKVIAAWEGGDLAGAVRELSDAIDEAKGGAA